MIKLPPLNGLRAFDAAGRRLSFRAAADDLGVTQGAVAQHVRHLEAHLGITLFERMPKGLAFTPAGRGYHARIAEHFAGLREATANLKPEPRKVLVSVTPTFAAKWLIPNLPHFSQAHPDIDLRIMATEKVSSFHSDGIDIAIRQGSPPASASLETTLLFKQELVAVAAPGLAMNEPTQWDREMLAKLPKIHDTHDRWQGYLANLNIRDQSPRGLHLSQTALAVDAAIAGQGVALVSQFLVSGDLNAGRLIQVGEAWAPGGGDFYLVAERSGKHNASASRVMDWLKSRSRKQTSQVES
ncbi:MAG: LysR substrate-binding domain-containing protein [Arenibacterium sp.]